MLLANVVSLNSVTPVFAEAVGDELNNKSGHWYNWADAIKTCKPWKKQQIKKHLPIFMPLTY